MLLADYHPDSVDRAEQSDGAELLFTGSPGGGTKAMMLCRSASALPIIQEARQCVSGLARFHGFV